MAPQLFARQLGDGELMHGLLGVPVASDFRSADRLEGGQGAPLVPAYHQALDRQLKLGEPALFLNLGGVANITYVDGPEDHGSDSLPEEKRGEIKVCVGCLADL